MTGPPGITRVKVCGLTRRGDVEHAAEAGADYVGVILVPETPRCVPRARAPGLVEGVSASPVAVVADLGVDETADLAGAMEASVIQLHGREPPELVARVREAGPWTVWKALQIRDPADLEQGVSRYGQTADGLLLDGWDTDRKGGTGRAFAWTDVSESGQVFPSGLILIVAGGLAPENVSDAIRVLRPDVVDVSSGVETRPGVKDRTRVDAFIRAVHRTERGKRP